ncbi:TPA: type II toxin-antitoxin system RelE/ParE family toxin [Neisseria meningitidis]
MRIFKNQWIVKFAKKHKINDSELLEAVERADNGLIDTDLGGGVIKQRIARQGQGRSGGYRSLILLKQADRAFFVYAFAKNDRENISDKELDVYRKAAAYYLKYTRAELAALKEDGIITEIES